MKLTGRLDHDPDLSENALKRLIYARFKQLELLVEGRGFMVVDDPVAAGKRVNDDGSTRWARGGMAGQSDLRMLVLGEGWSCEVKTRKGRQSKLQREYQRRVELAGGRYYVARNLEEALVPVCEALGVDLVVGLPF